jgi:hypothetical protein
MTTGTIQPGARAALASPFTPLAVINGTPIYPLGGGRSGGGISIMVGDDDDRFTGDADGDDEDDEDDDEQDGDEDERPAARRSARSDGTGADDWTPPTREAYERLTAAHRRANSEAGKRRRVAKVMEQLGIDDLPTWLTERGIDPNTGQPYGSDVVDPEDDGDLYEVEPVAGQTDERRRDRETARTIAAARQRAENEARNKYVPLVLQAQATVALREAGFNGTPQRMERLLRMIDPNEIDVVVDGDAFDIEGLDEAVAQLQEDFPELFEESEEGRRRSNTSNRRAASTGRATSRRASGARDVDGGDRGRAPKKPLGWAEQIAAQMDRRGR